MLVIRTDFSDQRAWDRVRTALDSTRDGDYMYPPEYKDDRSYEDLSVDGVLDRLPKAIEDPFVAVVDGVATRSAEMPILLVDLCRVYGNYGRTIRAVAEELPSIEVNVSLGNLSLGEFADRADADGVIRSRSG